MASGWLQERLMGILKKHETFTDGSLMSSHQRQRPAEGALPSWGHLFVLGGVNQRYFHHFKNRLNELIKNSEIVTEENIHRLASDALKPMNDNHSFKMLEDHRSDLSQTWKVTAFHKKPRAFVASRAEQKTPMEFGYLKHEEEVVSIRHVLPLKAEESYFQAQSHGGIKNYRYDKVEWVSAGAADIENYLQPPYALHVGMDNSDFKKSGTKLRIVYGVWLNGGLELNIPQSSHPEDKDVSLFYAIND